MSILDRLKGLKRWRLDEDDFRDEIRAHLAMAEAERVAEGEDPRDARYAALREFGNVTLTTEAARGVWTPAWLDALRNLLSDVRYAIRTLAKNVAFAITVVAVLALGIGLNAAVFTMLKALALTPIAGVERSAQLRVIFGETSTGRQVRVSYPEYRYLRDHTRTFKTLFGSTVATLNLGRGRDARQVWGELVTGNYFQALGVRAALGRTLLPSDENAPGRHPVVVLGDGLWRRDFASDPNIVGRTLEINNERLIVAGVADPAFHGTTVVYDVDLYVPITMAPQLGFKFGSQEASPSGILSDPRAAVFYPQGHLRPGASAADAVAETDAAWTTLARERPIDGAVQRLRVVPFWKTPHGAPIIILPTLVVLIGMGLLVLTIACANVAGLVLVRGLSRRGEIAVRLALGASRARIMRLLIVENLVLAAPGALLGVLLARNGIPVLVGYAERLAAPDRVFFNVEVDGLVIGFAALVAVGAALVVGFVPALRSTKLDLVSAINEDASPRGAARGRLRAALVVAQVAVSLLLLVGAGLVTRSLDAARRTNPGYDASHVTAVTLDVAQNRYDEPRGRVFYRDLLDAVRADPGVESATIAAFLPLAFLETPPRRIGVDGYEPRRDEDLSFLFNTVGPDYFRTLRITVVAGREFERGDDESAAPVAVVNSTFARRFWGDAPSAIGKRIRVGDDRWRTVVGVAADVKYIRINESPRPYVYLPFLQSYRSNMVLHARGPASVEVLLDEARAHVKALDADLRIVSARPLAGHVEGALILFNLAAKMLFLFGVAGMALAALGTYGLVSYVVKQSTHEIGIRMALGASGPSIVRAFLGRGVWLGVVGAVLGVVAALAVGRLLGTVLFGVRSTDLTAYVSAVGVVLGGVIAASIVPAWRAARTSPLSALRHQ